MEPSTDDQMTERDLWDHLMTLIRLAAARPSRARFAAVGEAAVKWSQRAGDFPRDVTSHSGPETPIYKENPAQTTALDHLGRPVEPDEDGGYTTWATLDERLAVDDGEDA